MLEENFVNVFIENLSHIRIKKNQNVLFSSFDIFALNCVKKLCCTIRK